REAGGVGAGDGLAGGQLVANPGAGDRLRGRQRLLEQQGRERLRDLCSLLRSGARLSYGPRNVESLGGRARDDRQGHDQLGASARAQAWIGGGIGDHPVVLGRGRAQVIQDLLLGRSQRVTESREVGVNVCPQRRGPGTTAAASVERRELVLPEAKQLGQVHGL